MKVMVTVCDEHFSANNSFTKYFTWSNISFRSLRLLFPYPCPPKTRARAFKCRSFGKKKNSPIKKQICMIAGYISRSIELIRVSLPPSPLSPSFFQRKGPLFSLTRFFFFICSPLLFWPYLPSWPLAPGFTRLSYSARTARSGQRDRNAHW